MTPGSDIVARLGKHDVVLSRRDTSPWRRPNDQLPPLELHADGLLREGKRRATLDVPEVSALLDAVLETGFPDYPPPSRPPPTILDANTTYVAARVLDGTLGTCSFYAFGILDRGAGAGELRAILRRVADRLEWT